MTITLSSDPSIATTFAAPAEKRVRVHLIFNAPHDTFAAGALVNARTQKRKLKPRRTSQEGAVDFDDLVASEGPLLITVRDARWGKQHFVAEIQPKPQKFTLDRPRTGSLQARIHTTEDMTPHGISLALVDQDGTTTALDGLGAPDEYGMVGVDVVAGRYRVRANAPGYSPSDWVETKVRVGEPSLVELLLLRAGSITGTIMFPPGERGGRPVDVEIETQTMEGLVRELRPVKTAWDGGYVLDDLKPAWYRLRACDADHDGSWATLQLVEDRPVDNFTVFLDGARNEPAVEGFVHDDADQPVPRANVSIAGRRTLTDDKGHFVLRLDGAPSGISLAIDKDGYVSGSQSLFLAPEQRRLQGVDVTLEPLD